MADLMREHDSLPVLLRLQPSRRGDLARLLRLEVVRHNGLRLVVAPLPLQDLLGAVLVPAGVVVRGRGCLGGRIRHGRIFHRRLHVAVGLALLALLGRRRMRRAVLEHIEQVVHRVAGPVRVCSVGIYSSCAREAVSAQGGSGGGGQQEDSQVRKLVLTKNIGMRPTGTEKCMASASTWRPWQQHRRACRRRWSDACNCSSTHPSTAPSPLHHPPTYAHSRANCSLRC
jgi:hypothetical protein